MGRRKNGIRRERGTTLLIALIFLVMLTLFAVSGMNTGIINLRTAHNSQMIVEAEYAAQQAIERVLNNSANFTDALAVAASSTWNVDVNGDTVTDFSHDVKACALGQASSSIMARHVVGSNAGELRSLRETVRRMLKENGAPPAGKWADVAVLEPVRDYKARHASTMLTFDAVTDAIDQIEAKRKAMAAE